MDLPINSDEALQTTRAQHVLRTLFRILVRVLCVIAVVLGVIYGVLGWQDYLDAPHGGYTLIQNPDGSDLGYLDPRSGRLTAGVPPSRVRDFIGNATHLLSIAPDQAVGSSHVAESTLPAAHANNSNQPPAHTGPIPADLLGSYTSGDYELIISHAADSAKGAVNLSLLTHGTQVWTASATRQGDDIRVYKDQTHTCPLTINRLTGRLVFFAVGGAKHCGDLSMTGFYYAP